MPAGMDHDLLEITIPQLEKLYAAHQYTVTQVVRWYLARIAKYDGIYHAVQTIDEVIASLQRGLAKAAA